VKAVSPLHPTYPPFDDVADVKKSKTSEELAPPILIQDGSPPNWKRRGLHLLCPNRPGGKTPLS
jgi:hypothetical protein